MKYKKHMMILLAAIFLFAMATASATDSNDTAVAVEDTQSTDEIIQASYNDENVSAQTGTDVLSVDENTYSDLSNEISQPGLVKLAHKNYVYDNGETINITEVNKVIDGNGAVIDMAKSNIRAFYVSASGVTIKNLTIKNANYDGNGGAVYFENSGNVTNCNFADNTATYSGGAIYFLDQGTVTNCNFTGNKATGDDGGGAVYFNGNGEVTNCNFTNNSASPQGGAIRFSSTGTGTVTNCNFTNNTAMYGGAIDMNSGSVENCNFTGNTASGDGGAIWMYSGSVENCNFTNNTASQRCAVYFNGNGEVTNCNFINNTATFVGAVRMYSGSVENCNFINNVATRGEGGAIYFAVNNGAVTNCTFVNNSALIIGGAIFMISGSVSNCNFTGNNAITGSAIYFYSTSATKTISNSIFLNNRANAEYLEVTKNENNITITFIGNDNLLNAIYSRNDAEVTFTNVTYWGADGIAKTGSSATTPSRSNKAAGQNITVGVVVNDKIVSDNVYVTDENGTIVLNIVAGDNYYITARHDTDSYYTEAEKTISNNTKFNLNVTSQTTTNKTVNITAKSNIPNDVVKGKLLFILPNGTEIDANYASNGTWWAMYTFDDYAVYQINASYVGLDNVTVSNATINITKADSTVTLGNITLDYGESKNVTVTTQGATGITANINGTDVTVINNFTITISGLDVENYTLTVTTIPDGDHNPVTETAKITVNKAHAEITVDSEIVVIKVLDEVSSGAALTPADAGNLTYKSSNETVVIVKDGKIKALANGTATITVSFAGNDNYSAAENKTITVTVNLNDASVSVNNSTLNLFVDDTFNLIAATVPDGLNVTYVPDNSGIVSVDNKGVVTALKEGAANITVKVGGDGVYAENSTTVAVSVSKIPTEITLTNDTLDLKYGEFLELNDTLTPADAGNLTYVSSNESVVKVSENLVAAVGKGTATLTVSFIGNDKYAAAENKTITVNVSLRDASVSVENSTLDLYVDDRFDLNAATVPGWLNVEYASSDESVATVNDYGIVTAVGEGTATITLTVGDDVIFAVNSTEVTVSVSKIPTEIVLANETLDLKYGEILELNDTLTPSDAGNLTYTSSNESVIIVAENMVAAVGKGTATLTVSFAGNDKYAAAENKTITVTVSLRDTSVSVENSTLDLKVDDRFDLNATTVPGWINVEYASSDESVATVNNYGIVTAVGEGTATITLTVGDDIMYAINSTNVTVTVSKQESNMNVSMPENITVGKNTTVNVILPKDATGNVTVKVDGEAVDTAAVTDGSTDVTIPSMSARNHTVEIAYSGDDKYNSASKTAVITVGKDSTNITAADVTATYKVNKYLVINLTDSRGNPLANATVTVDLNGAKNYTTDENGQIKVKVSSLVPKTYAAKITFKGDDKYTGSNTTAKVTVKKATAKITAKAKTFKTTTKTKKYTVTLKANGKALKNKWVYLKVNGKTYKAKTNSKGKATFKITQLNKAGKYKATVTFKGNDYYKKATKKATIKVKSAWKTVQKGSKNSAIVKKIQRALKNHGYYLEYNGRYLKVDGIFWDYTEMAVKEFQNDKTLKVTGKVDEKTAKKLGII